ncbi:MerR family transcriptional regulator [Ancylobacter polymorphus]|uniref:DNA-binding transcriptional MerR regulator n=1 Tax=Ancylobacter polymorphus TaxID=223390 RepID=A0ABU0BGH7_9HYPH|nr:MerR family transcriptional regulator [Ancylobacter polymorphus]MDQ0304937.1 DNA-binding transcriptional MerR regulator [Ancylobacter polymorphus]
MTACTPFRTAAETACLLGVTVKALRVFERHGLVQAQRTAAGWRVYGPNELLRLHQVIWLKRLGLTLAQIAAVLHDRSVDLDRLLALQEEVLLDRKRSIDQALRLVRTARAKLMLGESLSSDELIALTKETAMTRETPDWAERISPSIDRHLTEAEREELKARYDGEAWERLIADTKSLLGTDPAAPAALVLAGRWKALTAGLTGGNQAVKEKLEHIQRDAWADPQAGQTFPVTPDVLAFVRAAVAKLDAQNH